MPDSSTTLEEVTTLALGLPPLERLRLIEKLASTLERDWQTQRPPLSSSYGLWADLGPAPSAEEIDEARREAWGSFSNEDT